MHTATEAAIEVMSNDMPHAAKGAESSHMLAELVAALGALLQAMNIICCIYNDDFQNLHERLTCRGGKNQIESVEQLQCDLPYNARREQVHKYSDRDVLNAQDEEALCEVAEKVLKCGDYRYIFCSAVQLPSW